MWFKPLVSQPRFGRTRPGFTLVELLVVIAIIGVMVGLLLPAVQAAREAARRMQCSNSEKQIALGMHNYSSSFKAFPYGFKREVAGQTHRRDSWFHRMLPFVEAQGQADLYNNTMTEYVHNMPATVIGNPVATFMCASDPSGPARGGGGNNNGFQGNYVVCAGGGIPTTPILANLPPGTIIDLNMIPANDDPGGMFSRPTSSHKTRDFRDCVDGTSNTLMLSEGMIRGATGTPAATWGEAGGYNGGGPHGGFGFSTGEAPNTSVPDRAYSCKTVTWPRAPCENGFADGLIGRWNFARSYHVGGVNVALMDGSVRFISDSIDRETWRNVGNRHDGGVLLNWD